MIISEILVDQEKADFVETSLLYICNLIVFTLQGLLAMSGIILISPKLVPPAPSTTSPMQMLKLGSMGAGEH
jgi:hypothetical protein